MSNEEMMYYLDKIDVMIENDIKLNKGKGRHVKQQKNKGRRKKIFSNELNER